MKKNKFYLLGVTLIFISISGSCSKKEPNNQTSTVKSKTSDSINNSKLTSAVADTSNLSKATFAAGCFWCEEVVFESIKGVGEVISGYAGGNTMNPTYQEIGTGRTGHAETIQIYYDSSEINFKTLLKVFFASQDPTQVNGQGPDIGSQYRTIIFYRNASEKQIAEQYIKELYDSKVYDKPIAAELKSFTEFWTAEKYHQDYIKHNPDDSYVLHESIPRLRKTQKQIPELLKPDKSIIDK
ncbi:MAG: peptide-methionine (S)-S-oxide reductase MsrA [Ignavibacteria bacterium]